MSERCVVIGGGASGLASAAILAAHGHAVTLVERAPRLGPVLRGFSRGGVHFDTGFHYSGGLGEGGVLRRLLRYLGVMERLEPVAFDTSGFDRYRDCATGFEFVFPTGRDAVQCALSDAFPAEAPAVRAYLEELDRACETFPYLNPRLDLETTSPIPEADGPTLAEVLEGLTQDRRLRRVLSLHTLLHGVAPEEVPFRYHAAVAGLYYHSVHTVRGGGRALVRAFADRLDELGVRQLTGRAVTEVLAGGGEVAGVRLADGETLPCRVCVSTVHPKLLLDLVPEGAFRSVYRRRVAALEETTSAHLLFLRCEGNLPLLERSNLLFDAEKDVPGLGALHYLNRSKGFSADGDQDGVVLIKPASSAEAARACGASPPGERSAEYPRDKQAVAQALFTTLERALPELAGRLTPVNSASPVTLRDYCGSPVGGMYGVKHRVGQYNPLPPTRLRGLYVAGQATGGAGVLGAVLSAFLSCGYIVGHGTLQRGVASCH